DVPGGLPNLGLEDAVAIGRDPIRDLVDRLTEPDSGGRSRRVVGLSEREDAALPKKLIHLLKVGLGPRWVDPVRSPALPSDDGDDRNVAGSVGDIDDVLEWDAPVLGGDEGIHVDLDKF